MSLKKWILCPVCENKTRVKIRNDTTLNTKGLVLHTDIGSQYTSEDFEEALQEVKIKQSFSRKECPYDKPASSPFMRH